VAVWVESYPVLIGKLLPYHLLEERVALPEIVQHCCALCLRHIHVQMPGRVPDRGNDMLRVFLNGQTALIFTFRQKCHQSFGLRGVIRGLGRVSVRAKHAPT